MTITEGNKHAMSKVALVTGITGQDGAYLAEFLRDVNHEHKPLIATSDA